MELTFEFDHVVGVRVFPPLAWRGDRQRERRSDDTPARATHDFGSTKTLNCSRSKGIVAGGSLVNSRNGHNAKWSPR